MVGIVSCERCEIGLEANARWLVEKLCILWKSWLNT